MAPFLSRVTASREPSFRGADHRRTLARHPTRPHTPSKKSLAPLHLQRRGRHLCPRPPSGPLPCLPPLPLPTSPSLPRPIPFLSQPSPLPSRLLAPLVPPQASPKTPATAPSSHSRSPAAPPVNAALQLRAHCLESPRVIDSYHFLPRLGGTTFPANRRSRRAREGHRP